MDLINVLESKIKELQGKAKDHVVEYNNSDGEIEKHISNKARIKSTLETVDGAIQAYNHVIGLLKSSTENDSQDSGVVN